MVVRRSPVREQAICGMPSTICDLRFGQNPRKKSSEKSLTARMRAATLPPAWASGRASLRAPWRWRPSSWRSCPQAVRLPRTLRRGSRSSTHRPQAAPFHSSSTCGNTRTGSRRRPIPPRHPHLERPPRDGTHQALTTRRRQPLASHACRRLGLLTFELAEEGIKDEPEWGPISRARRLESRLEGADSPQAPATTSQAAISLPRTFGPWSTGVPTLPRPLRR